MDLNLPRIREKICYCKRSLTWPHTYHYHDTHHISKFPINIAGLASRDENCNCMTRRAYWLINTQGILDIWVQEVGLSRNCTLSAIQNTIEKTNLTIWYPILFAIGMPKTPTEIRTCCPGVLRPSTIGKHVLMSHCFKKHSTPRL